MPTPPVPTPQAQAKSLIDAWVAKNLDLEDGAERRRRAVEAAERLVKMALSLEPAVAQAPEPRRRLPP